MNTTKIIQKEYFIKDYKYVEYVDYLYLMTKNAFQIRIKRPKNYNYLKCEQGVKFRRNALKSIATSCHNYIVNNSEYLRNETDEHIRNFYGKVIAFINKTQETRQGCLYIYNTSILNKIKEVIIIMDAIIDYRINYKIQELKKEGFVTFNKKCILYNKIRYGDNEYEFSIEFLFNCLIWILDNVIEVINNIDFELKNKYVFFKHSFDFKLISNLKLEFENMKWVGL